MKLKITKSISAVAATSFLVGSASAASLSFDGGTGTWDKVTTNWNAGADAFNDGDDVTFGGAAGNVSVAVDVGPGSITYSSDNNYNFSSSGGVITGSGSLTKNGTGRMLLGTMANTFSGGTTINSGRLQLNLAHIDNALGTGDIMLNGGSLYLFRATMANELIINGGTIFSDNGFGNNWNGGVTLNSNLDLNMLFNMSYNAVISGSGGIDIVGSNTVSLNAANTYTGATTVNGAVLAINGTSLDDSSALVIGSAGVVDLTGAEVVASLTLNGVVQTAPGTYGALGSGATNESALFTGTGFVNIVPVPEPSSTALLGLGGLGLLLRRRR